MELTVVIRFSPIWENFHPFLLKYSIQSDNKFLNWNSVTLICDSDLIGGGKSISKNIF